MKILGHHVSLVHTDIPTHADLEQLLSVRDGACVSIYLPTTPEERGERDRLEFRGLAGEALEQLGAAAADRGAVDELREVLDDLAEDDGFWARQAHSLAVFATPSGARTFQVANRLSPMVEVSDRFHVKPLLRSATFPQAAFVLALSQNAARLVEVSPAFVDIDESVPGFLDEADGALTLDAADDAANYGVVDEIARRVLLARARGAPGGRPRRGPGGGDPALSGVTLTHPGGRQRISVRDSRGGSRWPGR